MVPVPPSLRAAGFRSRSRASLGQRPLGLLSALVDVESRRLHDYRWGPHFNERAHALELFPSLRAGDTVVMDRGCFSRELLRAAHRLGVRVLFRLRSNALGEVIEWTTRAAPSRLPPTTDVEIAGAPCRLSAYRAHGARFICLTTARGPVRQLKELYRRRWRVETFFRSLKSDLRLRNIRTTSAACFAHALDAAAILHGALVAPPPLPPPQQPPPQQPPPQQPSRPSQLSHPLRPRHPLHPPHPPLQPLLTRPPRSPRPLHAPRSPRLPPSSPSQQQRSPPLQPRLRPPPTPQARPRPRSQPPRSMRRRSASWPGLRQAMADFMGCTYERSLGLAGARRALCRLFGVPCARSH